MRAELEEDRQALERARVEFAPFVSDEEWQLLNPLTPKSFCVFERFSAYTRPMGFRDSILEVTMESAAVLKH